MIKILNPMLCYNSLDLLPYIIEYNKSEGIDLFVLDNYSNDGSWEFLQHHKIPSKRVDTNNSFDLDILLKEKLNVINQIKPDWIVNSGSDDFIIPPSGTLRNFIESMDKINLSIIECKLIRFNNTGEPRKYIDLRREFFYCDINCGYLKSIHRYKNFIQYFGDDPIMDCNHTIGRVDNLLFLDYGNARNKELREDIYERRKLAWERGLPRNFGIHYESYSKRDWLWNKNELTDIRKTKFWSVINNKFNF